MNEDIQDALDSAREGRRDDADAAREVKRDEHQTKLDAATLTVAGTVAAEVAAQTMRPAVRQLKVRDVLIAGVCTLGLLLLIGALFVYVDNTKTAAQAQRDAFQGQLTILEQTQGQYAAQIAVLRAELVRLGENPDTLLKKAGVSTQRPKAPTSSATPPAPASKAPTLTPAPTPKVTVTPAPIVSLPAPAVRPSPSLIFGCVLVVCVG